MLKNVFYAIKIAKLPSRPARTPENYARIFKKFLGFLLIFLSRRWTWAFKKESFLTRLVNAVIIHEQICHHKLVVKPQRSLYIVNAEMSIGFECVGAGNALLFDHWLYIIFLSTCHDRVRGLRLFLLKFAISNAGVQYFSKNDYEFLNKKKEKKNNPRNFSPVTPRSSF